MSKYKEYKGILLMKILKKSKNIAWNLYNKKRKKFI